MGGQWKDIGIKIKSSDIDNVQGIEDVVVVFERGGEGRCIRNQTIPLF